MSHLKRGRHSVLADGEGHRNAEIPRPMRPVVVAMDGSGEARAALDWAAGWAVEQRLTLQALAAHSVTAARVPLLPRMAVRAQQDLDNDLASVCQSHPGLVVDRIVVWDNTSAALVSASRSATAVVLPGPADRPWTQTTMSSASATVAAHARCPVICVPHDYPGGWRPPQRVVLALDGSPESVEAAEFAFAQADCWSAPLSAVHALDKWSLTGWSSGPLQGSDVEHLTAELEDAVLTARRRHPTVAAEISLVHGPPGGVLRELSEPSSLLVVGSRGLGGFAGLLLGSFSRTAMQSSRCPVAVVRAGDLDATTAEDQTP